MMKRSRLGSRPDCAEGAPADAMRVQEVGPSAEGVGHCPVLEHPSTAVGASVEGRRQNPGPRPHRRPSARQPQPARTCRYHDSSPAAGLHFIALFKSSRLW